MNNTKKTFIAGGIIAGAIFGTAGLNASETNLFRYSELGSGSVVRANLLDQAESDTKAYLLDLNCGEDVKKAADSTKVEDKSKEAKCGEKKATGNQTKFLKSDNKTKADTTAKESKSKDAKCGEGKCGVQ